MCFYELNGLDEHPSDPDPFNIFSHPSWLPLIQLTREKTDRIVMRQVPFVDAAPDALEERTSRECFVLDGSQIEVTRVDAGSRILTARTRRDPDTNTLWHTEHLLKSADDLEDYLGLPNAPFSGQPDPQPILQTEAALGDTGIAMLETGDPLCMAAGLFDLQDYLVVALTEPALFHRLLERCAAQIYPLVEAAARALPGRLWRICGPEYATPPYLPPRLFREYVVRYLQPIIASIQRYGGYARVHCHGRIHAVLDDIAAMNPDGLDPIEPPPQGDIELIEVRQRHGRQMVLFGNLEFSDIETLPTPAFAEKVRRALAQGTAGEGRGFVLMPSACPIGRELSALTLRNYESMVELAEKF